MSEFTPLPDPIVSSMGIYAASVYGRVWRYCQMERGRCFAPAHRIATELNLGQRTVERYLSRLVEDGWIERDSGKSDGKPSTYYTTGKWVMGGSATAADPSARTADPLRHSGGHKKQDKTEEENTTAQPPTGGRWTGFHSVVSTDITGNPDSYLTNAGGVRAYFGRLAKVAGEATNGDPDAACELWRAFQENAGHRLTNRQSIIDAFGKWAKDNPPPAPIPADMGQYFTADGRLKQAVALMSRPEFAGADAFDPATWPASYRKAVEMAKARHGN